MKITVKNLISIFLLMVLFSPLFAIDCPECEEVAKGMIPQQYLMKTMKVHPAGFPVWDNEEAFAAFMDREGKYLWVDTRPSTFYTIGTIRDAVLLVCDQKGKVVPPPDDAKELTKERLIAAMEAVDPDITKVKVIFFCQGPKCHRSYNAALRCIDDYKMDPGQVVWYRDGYPNMLEAIENDPKLKKRITRYLQGDVVQE